MGIPALPKKEAMAEEQRKAQELQDGSPHWEWGSDVRDCLGGIVVRIRV